MSEPDLSTVTTPELIDELQRRHKASIVVTHEDPKIGHTGDVYGVFYRGGMVHCLGLAEYAKVRLVKAISDQESDQ